MFTRRAWIASATATAAARAASFNPLSGPVLYKDILHYASLGDHRTATETDHKTASWLASEMKIAGFAAELHPFFLQQFFPAKVSLRASGRDIQTSPLWWPKTTGPKPIAASFVRDPKPDQPLGGKIAVIKLASVPGAALLPDCPVHKAVEPIARAGAVAAVIITASTTGELIQLNAMAGLDAWPLPILLAGEKDEPALIGEGSFLLDGHYDPKARAFEVVGRFGNGPRTFIVSTPYSGWFRCAGERGPGIALWLGLARYVAKNSRDRWIFVASSGHELHSKGILTFLEALAPKPSAVTAWLHLGAGIATYRFDGRQRQSIASPMRRIYSTPVFVPLLKQAFAAMPELTPVVTDKPAGEMLEMAHKGYPYFGFAGGSTFHHMPGDLPERTTGPELLEPIGAALLQVLSRL